jgi:hypothetical protein
MDMFVKLFEKVWDDNRRMMLSPWETLEQNTQDPPPIPPEMPGNPVEPIPSAPAPPNPGEPPPIRAC